MLASTEVRWFINGPLTEDVNRWFDEFDPEFQPSRMDYYFGFTENARVGIKLREENIQLKPEILDLGSKIFLEGVEGKVGNYEKWSFPVESNEEWAALIQRPEVWIPVKKTRKLLRFSLEGGFPDKINMEEWVREGCEVELSEIEILDKTCWSLAFEAFGSDAEANLQKTIYEVFEKNSCPISFNTEKSFGYARLIRDIQEYVSRS